MSRGYLADSHVALWYLTDPARPSDRALAVFDEPANRVLVSDVTVAS